MGILVRAIALAATVVVTPASADEDYCGDIPVEQLRFEYRVSGPDRVTIKIHLPLRYRKARFQDVSAVFGDDRSYAATLATEKDEGELLAKIYVPRDKEVVRLEAVYTEKKCFWRLKATFRNGRRENTEKTNAADCPCCRAGCSRNSR